MVVIKIIIIAATIKNNDGDDDNDCIYVFYGHSDATQRDR